MSSTKPTYHIAFPTAFLSLNPKVNKTTVNGNDSATSPESQLAPHPFLSNRPHPRHNSLSSVSSAGSDAGVASASSVASRKSSSSSENQPQIPAFLTLNTKHTVPPTSAKAMSEFAKSGFLSNRN